MKKILLSIIALSVFLPAISFASIDANLSYGARGSSVVELQQFLINKGFLSTEATGNFFGLTKSAVISYQVSKGLPGTGFVGPLTRSAIASDLVEAPTPASTTVAPACATGVAYSYLTGEPCPGTVPATVTPVNSATSTISLPTVSLSAVGTVVPAATGSIAAQFVPASTSGAANAAKTTFNLNMINGSGTITELTFSLLGTPGAASSVMVDNVSAPVINGVAYLTGLSIPVPNGGGGVNVEAWTSYATVGVNGIPSGSTSTIELTKITYTNGSGTQSLTGLTIDGKQMTLVGSRPTVTLTLPNGATGSSASGLSVGQKYVADVNIKADEKGDIKINTLPINFNGSNADTKVTITDATDLVIKDGSGASVNDYTVGSIVGSGTSTVSAVITFTNGGYRIDAGQTATFKIEANISAVSGSGASLAVGISPGTSFTWTDLAGNGAIGALDGSSGVMPSYPYTTVSLRN